MRRIAVLFVAVALGAACTSSGAVTSRASTTAGPKLLFFANSLGVTVVDAPSGRATVTVPEGVLAPDRSAVYGTTEQGGRTTLRAFEPQTGTSRQLEALDGSRRVRVANHDGSLVLLGPAASTAAGYPVGRTTTVLTVVPTDGSPSRAVNVAANVEPEAFSADDTNVFVLQYLPADAPLGYQVRRLDLSTGELHNIKTDDSDLDKPMAGRARTQVLSPDGTRLYTLYVVGAPSATEPGYAFVHVLDLVDKEAFCVDLPAPFGTDGSTAYGIAITKDGADVYAVDGQHGAIARLDTRALAVTATSSIPPLPGAATFAAVDPDGNLLVGAGPEIRSLDRSTYATRSNYRFDASIAAIITTDFDRNVYVAVNDVIHVLRDDDIAAGPTSSIHVSGAPGLVAADPVPPIDGRGPTQCAC